MQRHIFKTRPTAQRGSGKRSSLSSTPPPKKQKRNHFVFDTFSKHTMTPNDENRHGLEVLLNFSMNEIVVKIENILIAKQGIKWNISA